MRDHSCAFDSMSRESRAPVIAGQHPGGVPPIGPRAWPGADLSGFGFVADQFSRDVAFEDLLNHLERIQDLMDLLDAAIAQRVERRDVELHDAAVGPLAEEHAN